MHYITFKLKQKTLIFIILIKTVKTIISNKIIINKMII